MASGSSSNSKDIEKETLRAEDLEKAEQPPPPHRTDEVADAIYPPTQEHVGDAESLASVNLPPSEAEVEEGGLPGAKPSQIAKTYATFSLPAITSLMAPSVFGVLARLGLLAITGYDEHAVFPLAWVQAAGCLIMGFTLGLRDQIGAYYGPLYTAITTGFCGSLTTFSSWQLDVFLSWANTQDAHRDWFRDVIDGLAKTIFTLAISLSSVTLGLHLARQVSRFIPRIKPAPPLARHIFRVLSVLVYAATLPAYFKASPSFRHQATAALLFSFPGTLTRYVLATKLTPLLTLFPLGTFVANTVGSALLGVFHVLQRRSAQPSPNACAILQGLMDGYCGCLTTVSTFAVEVGALKARRAWLYVGLSWAVSQLLLLIVMGVSWWGADINESRMCAFALS